MKKYWDFYDLNDKPIRGDHTKACLKWGKMMEKDRKGERKFIVKQEKNWMGFWVSTVWLGLNHSFDPSGKSSPLIYETMVFFHPPFGMEHKSDLDCFRYPNRHDAFYGHKQIVDEWKKPEKVLVAIALTFQILWKTIKESITHEERDFWKKLQEKKS